MTNNTIRTNTGTYGVSDTAAIGPLMQGQAGVVMTFTLTDLSGTAVNLTGLTITGTITNNQTKATAALQGAIALVTPASGIFSWTTDADDVGTAGSFKVIFTVGTSLITLPAHLAIIETPAATTTFGAALVGVTVAEAAWLTAALAALPDAGDLANVPDPAGATDGYVWTADGADGANWEAPAGGASDVGDLTTTTGNSTEMVRVAAAGGLEYRTPAQVLSDIGAASASALNDYLPKSAGSGEGVTGVLYLDPGADDAATLLRVPITTSDGADILLNVARADFSGVEDVTLNVGYNNGGSGALDGSKHAWYSQWEYRYNTAGTEWAEYHLNLLGAAGAFAFRPVEYKFDVTGASGTISYKSSVVSWESIGGHQAMRLQLGASSAATELNVYGALSVHDSQNLTVYGGSVQVSSPDNTKVYSFSISNAGVGQFTLISGTAYLSFNNFSAIEFPTTVFYSSVLDCSTHINVASGKVYKVNNVQVVGARVVDARISNTPNSGDATTDDLIDAMRDAMLAHGLMAAA